MNFYIKRLKRIILLCLTAILILSTLCSCGGTEDKGEAKTVCFTDALGREVEVATSPRRVAALLGSFADIWTLAGGELCAAAEDAWEDFGLELTAAIDIGGAHSPSLELLVASDPELVLASASTASNVEMKDALEQMGITVVYFDVDNFEDYLYMLDICTDITGRKDLYRQNGEEIARKIEAVKKDFADAGIDESERRVLLLRASSGKVKAKGSEGTVLGEMLRDIGCINIADSDTSLPETLSVESVIANEPRHIFVVTMGNDIEAARESLTKMMEENPAWGTLEAVKENRLHVMDKELFNLKPNARWAEAYEKLYETLVQ